MSTVVVPSQTGYVSWSFTIADANRIYPPPAPSEVVKTSMVETPNGRGAWLRAWPSGHVHYSPEWYVSDNPGRMDTLCGRSRIFWPEDQWPTAKICPTCSAKVLAELEAAQLEERSSEASTKEGP